MFCFTGLMRLIFLRKVIYMSSVPQDNKPETNAQTPSSENTPTPSLTHASICCIGLLAWIAIGLFVLKAGLHGVLLIGLVWVSCNALFLGCTYARVREAMMKGSSRAMPALFIFLLIGVVIVTFIHSGTVATLVYYGLKFLSPGIFLPAGLILCSLMSLATGTSWGTVGTGGIVLIGVGGAMGIPLPIVAGMVISGASFGDKMSPVSDTTNLSALSADCDLYTHIRSMLYTTGPSYLIALIGFSLIGWGYADQRLPEEELGILLSGLESAFTINIFMLLPMVVLLLLAMRRVPAEAAMLIASLVAALMAIIFQGRGFTEVINGFYDGAVVTTGNETLDSLLSRGGIVDMAWTFTLSIIAIALGALLDTFGFLKTLLEAILRRIKQAAGLVTSAILTGYGGNLLLGEGYIAIILTGQLFKKPFDEAQIDRSVLSRSIEEGSTLMTALVPWTTTGAFYTATLGIATMEYFQWALLNWINPLVGILFAWLGIGLFRTVTNNAEETPAKT